MINHSCQDECLSLTSTAAIQLVGVDISVVFFPVSSEELLLCTVHHNSVSLKEELVVKEDLVVGVWIVLELQFTKVPNIDSTD